MKNKKELISEVIKNEIYLKESRYAPFIQRARQLLDEEKFDAVEEVLRQVPTEKELLEEMVEKLKNKSVYKALKRGLKEGNNPSGFLKGLFSLGAHILIECESGNKEYKILLPTIYNRIGSLITEL